MKRTGLILLQKNKEWLSTWHVTSKHLTYILTISAYDANVISYFAITLYLKIKLYQRWIYCQFVERNKHHLLWNKTNTLEMKYLFLKLNAHNLYLYLLNVIHACCYKLFLFTHQSFRLRKEFFNNYLDTYRHRILSPTVYMWNGRVNSFRFNNEYPI